jgi:hypothetical protein
MIRRRGKKNKEMGQDVAAVNRLGCGCITFILFGTVIAMIVSAFFQLQK